MSDKASEISVVDERDIQRLIHKAIFDFNEHNIGESQAEERIYKAIRPYLRTTEPVSGEHILTGEHGGAWHCSICGNNRCEVAQANVTSPTEILGLTIQEIATLQRWFEQKSGKSIADFWSEAFDAGVESREDCK